MVYQNLPHQMRRDTEKVRAAFPVGQTLRNQPKVDFMHQGRRLKSRGRMSSVRKFARMIDFEPFLRPSI